MIYLKCTIIDDTTIDLIINILGFSCNFNNASNKFNTSPFYGNVPQNRECIYIVGLTVINKDTIYQLKRSYVRENKKEGCPTLTASMGTRGNNVPLVLDNYGVRKLTTYKCFISQEFLENYKIPNNTVNSHLYNQIGNIVN